MPTAQITEPNYDIKRGPLAQTYGMFVKGTRNTGAQISVDRITDEGLRSEWFYVSNVPFATKRKGKLLLGIGITPSAFDVVYGRNTQDVCQELIKTGYVKLNALQKRNILALERRGEVVFVDPNEMDLQGNEAEYRRFPIRTAEYDKDITIARMPWVSAGYSSGYILKQVMDNLNTNDIDETTVFTINPEHAAENVVDDEIVARASGLNDFDDYSFFDAYIRNVDDHLALRGVLLDESAAGGEEIGPLETVIGKASVAHEDIAVVRKGDVSPEDWKLLTQR